MELLHKKEKKTFVNNEKSPQIRTTQSELHTTKRMEMEETKKNLIDFFLSQTKTKTNKRMGGGGGGGIQTNIIL